MSDLNDRDDLKAAVEDAIAARRADAEFMDRRDRHVEEHKAVLDRLASLNDDATNRRHPMSDTTGRTRRIEMAPNTDRHVPTVTSWHRPHEHGFEPGCTCGWFGNDASTIVAAARTAHDHARMSNDSTAEQPLSDAGDSDE